MAITIALLHPGEMGAAVGACLSALGHRVLWVAEGRSDQTRQRAAQASLEEVPNLRAALAQADVVLSICPPHGAVEQARTCLNLGFRGTYVDANAVSPQTAREIEANVNGRNATFVDGGIIGPPPVKAGTTRMYLSGHGASAVAALFEGSVLETPVLETAAGSASALKMCYAAWTKGASAMLAAIRALATHENVDGALVAEWNRSLPGTAERSEAITVQARKAWRWIGEMEEIAATFEQAQLPGGFHAAAAEVYRRLDSFKEEMKPVELERIVAAMNGGLRKEE